MHVLQGAFIVNATVDATGSVSDVRLLAEAGGPCVFLDPWQHDDTGSKIIAPTVTCDGVAVAVKPSLGPTSKKQQAVENWFQFDTTPGDICTISR
eukprot:COSAG02_NODE_21592_length_782_cov_0.891654_1_plen_95_part_00